MAAMSTTEIGLEVDLKPVLSWLATIPTEIPKANAYVLNLTGEKALAMAREMVSAKFTVRVPWVLPPARLPREWKARSDNPVILISLGYGGAKSSGGDRRRNMLGKFERGGEKVAKRDDEPIAIPTKAIRPTATAKVQMSMYPKSLRLAGRLDPAAIRLPKQTRQLKGGGAVGAGKRGTFELDPAMMKGLGERAWGIYQRFGPKRNDVAMIWAYRRRIPIPKRLTFHTEAAEIVSTFLLPRLQEEYEKRWAREASA
jgi:hypothetical protein